MTGRARLSAVLLFVGAAWALSPWSSSALALLAGVTLALAGLNLHAQVTGKLSAPLLQAAIVGLGLSLHLDVVLAVGVRGMAMTAAGLALSIGAGAAIGALLGVARSVGFLVSVGTAICGGSAIAAVAAATGAKKDDTTVALGVVFLLNAVGLMVFPPLGHALGLDEGQFGTWAALAIHDTSSVVGAASSYGPHALEVATTTKLARALWILPLSAIAAVVVAVRGGGGWRAVSWRKLKVPWFLFLFVAAAALGTVAPGVGDSTIAAWIVVGARRLFVLSLFLIGANLSPSTLRAVGPRPLVLGVALWAVIGAASLVVVRAEPP